MCNWQGVNASCARIDTALEHFLASLPAESHCAVAFSGGQDSTVLLYALNVLQEQRHFSLSAYHVNHQLSPHADEWAKHLAVLCEKMQIPFHCLTLMSAPALGESVEAWAREARYAALQKALPEKSVLVTAHHAQDQAETVLLQLLRGAGPKGLSGMGSIKPLDKSITLYRPFLNITQQEIEEYARTHALTWIEDPSNHGLRFDRNFIRHEILPLLETRFPSASSTIARAAAHMQSQEALLEMFLNERLPELHGSVAGTLSVTRLLALPKMILRPMLRQWLSLQGILMPSQTVLENMVRSVLHANPQAHPAVHWGGWVVTRHRDDIYSLPAELLKDLSDKEYAWDPRMPLVLPDGAGTWHKEDLLKAGVEVVEGAVVRICFRRGGETIFVPGVGHQSLKKWFQTRDIPVWMRGRVPLVYDGKTVKAILIK